MRAEIPAEMGAAIAERKALALEDARAESGALGYAVRTPAQWELHPQGRAVARRPLIELTHKGSARTARRPARADPRPRPRLPRRGGRPARPGRRPARRTHPLGPAGARCHRPLAHERWDRPTGTARSRDPDGHMVSLAGHGHTVQVIKAPGPPQRAPPRLVGHHATRRRRPLVHRLTLRTGHWWMRPSASSPATCRAPRRPMEGAASRHRGRAGALGPPLRLARRAAPRDQAAAPISSGVRPAFSSPC